MVAGPRAGAVVAVVVPFSREAWVWVAYEKALLLEGHAFSTTDSRGSDEPEPITHYFDKPALKTRWRWLPGPEYCYDKTCLVCSDGRHESCMGEHSYVESDQHPYHETYACTCPGPSHEWNQ